MTIDWARAVADTWAGASHEQCANKKDRKPSRYFHCLPPKPKAKVVALTATLMPINTKPSPRASERLPLLVSSAIAVVMVRV